jgi:O-acetyl-ADP-ribose deacetylase (regulator of RNase III)
MGEYLNGKILVTTGDITKITADAIVNAANSSLMGGGGVDGAIHRAGGPSILEACKQLRRETYPNGLPAGQAAATTAGKLPASIVIHTVGPVWRGGGNNEDSILRDCYMNSLKCAAEHDCKTIAFPAVSTGVYGFPKDRAAGIASTAARDFLTGNNAIDKVLFVFFSIGDMAVFEKHQVF